MQQSKFTTPELISLAHSGDSTAFENLMADARRYLRFLSRGKVNEYLRGKVDESDLVQDALFEAHRHFHLFRGDTEAQFLAWLRSILTGRVSNQVRQFMGTKQRNPRLEKSIAADLSNTSFAFGQQITCKRPAPSEQVMQREISLRAAVALESLPSHYRQVILFRLVDDLTFPEIAGRMQRSVDSVEKLWVRALARLRQDVGDEHEQSN